ncbi:MAG: hypothetical protein Q9170_006080, partial [Blastenia crenularia]
MPLYNEEHRQELRDKQESFGSPHSSSSPPPIEHQESIKNASLLGQSPSAHRIGTSPHHQRFKSVIPIDPPSATAPPTSAQQRPTSSPSSLPGSTPSLSTVRGSYFSSQPGSSGIESRSPANKRAPASRSSHGIATAGGPPPALITQRSYHGEAWRNPLDVDQPNPPSAQSRIADRSGSSTLNRQNRSSYTMNGVSGNHGATLSHTHPPTEEDDDTLRTFDDSQKSNRPLLRSTHNQSEEDHSYSSHEDLFLNLARTDSETGSILNSTTKTTRRDSQLGLSSSRSVRTSRLAGSRPASSGRELGEDRIEDPLSSWSRSTHLDTYANDRTSSSPRDRGYAASAHPLDQGKRRYLHSELSSKASLSTPRGRNGSNRDASPGLPGSSGRRQSITESASGLLPRTYNHIGRYYISGNHYGSSPIANVSPNNDPTGNYQSSRLDGTESTISTTAPSTVWDELDDLKSRIRKIELTGKLPSSSGAAMNSVANGRPHTATTTMTTASISPKHGRANVTSPEASTVKDMDTLSLHPLLHSALAKAKSRIDPNAYKALEATASDALTLTAMTGNTKLSGEEVPVKDTSQTTYRRVRAKADSMCRSLTELCIALSEEKSSTGTSTSTSRPGSKAGPSIFAGVQTPENGSQVRPTSQEPERCSSRIMSRLEARRTSLQAASATPPSNNQTESHPTSSPIVHNRDSSTRADRTASALLHRRRTVDGNMPTDLPATITPPTTTTTPPSQRPPLPTRLSREYTSQHPLPTHGSPSVRSSLPSSSARRSYLPSTPNNTIQPGSRRYLSSSTERQISSAESNTQRLAEARQQRIASLG